MEGEKGVQSAGQNFDRVKEGGGLLVKAPQGFVRFLNITPDIAN